MAEKQDHQVTSPVSKAADLTLTKVLAGGMAAATSAVLGSQFGAPGTVGGAAAGSVVTMVGSSVYQRSLERTRDRVVQRMPRAMAGAAGRAASTTPNTASGSDAPASDPRAGAAPALEVSAASEPDRPPRAAPSRGRWAFVVLVGSLLVFAVGMGAVTGIERVRGAALSGSPGQTSLDAVLSPGVVGDLGGADSTRSEDESPGSPLPPDSSFPSGPPVPSQLPDEVEQPDPRDLLPSPDERSSESGEPDRPLLPGVEDVGP